MLDGKDADGFWGVFLGGLAFSLPAVFVGSIYGPNLKKAGEVKLVGTTSIAARGRNLLIADASGISTFNLENPARQKRRDLLKYRASTAS